MKRLFLMLVMLLATNIPLFAAKTVFERTKPHVNVGTIGNIDATMWIHSTIVLRGDGEASGVVQFAVLDGEKFFYRVISAEAVAAGGEVIGLDVVVARVGGGGEDTGELDFLTIRRGSTLGDDLIYDVLGANVHVESEGTIELLEPGND